MTLGSSSCWSKSDVFKILKEEPSAALPTPRISVRASGSSGPCWWSLRIYILLENDNFGCCWAVSVCAGGAGEGGVRVEMLLGLLAGHGGAGGPAVGPKSRGVALGGKSLPEAVSSPSRPVNPGSPKANLLFQSTFARCWGSGCRTGQSCHAGACAGRGPSAAVAFWWGSGAGPGEDAQCPGSRGQPRWGSARLPFFLPGLRQGERSSGGRWLGRCPARRRGLVLPARKQAVIVCAQPAAPGAACATGAGSWLRALRGSLHPRWSLCGRIQLQGCSEAPGCADAEPAAPGYELPLLSTQLPSAGMLRPMERSSRTCPPRRCQCHEAASPPAGKAVLGLPFPEGDARDWPRVPEQGTAHGPARPTGWSWGEASSRRAAQPRRWYAAAPVLGCGWAWRTGKNRAGFGLLECFLAPGGSTAMAALARGSPAVAWHSRARAVGRGGPGVQRGSAVCAARRRGDGHPPPWVVHTWHHCPSPLGEGDQNILWLQAPRQMILHGAESLRPVLWG